MMKRDVHFILNGRQTTLSVEPRTTLLRALLGILPVQEASALTPMRNVLVIPGADVLIRWIEVKAASEAQARAAALAQLEDHMTSAAGAHLALGAAEADGCRLVAVLAAVQMKIGDKRD